jgi:hypothetical protein
MVRVLGIGYTYSKMGSINWRILLRSRDGWRYSRNYLVIGQTSGREGAMPNPTRWFHVVSHGVLDSP